MFVLALPLDGGSDAAHARAFVGGLSAATAMVIVESVALAIMVSNDIVMPLVLQRREALTAGDVGRLACSRSGAWRSSSSCCWPISTTALGNDAQLAAIGLLSFAAIAQLAPAFFGGLFWRAAPRAAPWPA